MCGIAGYFSFDRAEGDGPDVRQALSCIGHRGPDDEGMLEIGRAVLGHRRLSIIDTSPAGHQPFVDEGGRYAIVFNGEIFNFLALRGELEAQGHRFRSHTDTEVALRLFALKGPAFLHDLNGFFALAIHDRETNSLFLARDRFGVKPLLWAEHRGRLLFASELRALMALGVPREIDPVSLRMYFTHYYIPAPYSILQAVRKVPPGHSITIAATGLRLERWYDCEAASASSSSAAEPEQRLRSLLDDAVRIRLISDVPIGTFLSGGLDSSIISALAKRHKPDLRTFSIGYTDRYYDETPFAESVAQHIGSDHTTFTLGPQELAHAYDRLLDAIDEPFADQSALPSYVLNERTRAHVTVALSGDGADEVFGGYRKHQAELRAQEPGIPEQLAIAGAPIWRLLPKSRNNPLTDRIRQLDRFARTAKLTASERYLLLASWDDALDARDLIAAHSDEQEFTKRRALITAPLGRHRGLNALLFTDLATVLPDDMLYKVDLTSMAHALEVRTPFLDRRLVEFAFSLPAEVKLRRGAGKHLLRTAFSDLLPETTLKRSKRGFEVPLTPMLKGPQKHRVNALRDAESLRSAGLDVNGVRGVVDRFLSNDPGSSQATVHALIVYITWWKAHVGRGS